MITLNEQIQRLRDVLVTCYNAIKRKGGTIPEVGERNMTNLPDAVRSIPQEHTELTELTVTANKVYLPDDYDVDGFSKVTARFDTSSMPKVKVSTFTVTNDCINEDGRWEGESLIDTSECTTFQSAFQHCNKLKKINSQGWCTNKVTSLHSMFNGCNSLEEVDLRDWDTSNVINAYYFVYQNDVIKLKNLDFTSWDLGNLTNLYMLAGLGEVQTLVGGRTLEDVVENNITIFKNLKIPLLYLDAMPFIDRASLRALINGLADFTGQITQTLTLGATLIAKLTEEDIAIAVAKNWSIA